MGGKLLNEYPVEKFFGRGVVIDARGKTSVGAELLSGMDIKSGDVVLICFGWSEVFHNDEYYLNYPVISEGFAKKLVELGVAMVGMDTPSPDKAPYGVHKILLKQDILIIENLTNLETLFAYPNWEIVALPAKLEAEAGLCRVVAKIL
jgi:kynurenine formamidase